MLLRVAVARAPVVYGRQVHHHRATLSPMGRPPIPLVYMKGAPQVSCQVLLLSKTCQSAERAQIECADCRHPATHSQNE